MPQHRFGPTTFFIWSGLLIYAADFLFVYALTAIVCARQLALTRLLGMPLIPFATTVAGVAAAAAIGAVMWIAVRRNRRDATADEHTRFIRFLAIAGGGLSLLALVWLTLPPLLIENSCAAP